MPSQSPRSSSTPNRVSGSGTLTGRFSKKHYIIIAIILSFVFLFIFPFIKGELEYRSARKYAQSKGISLSYYDYAHEDLPDEQNASLLIEKIGVMDENQLRTPSVRYDHTFRGTNIFIKVFAGYIDLYVANVRSYSPQEIAEFKAFLALQKPFIDIIEKIPSYLHAQKKNINYDIPYYTPSSGSSFSHYNISKTFHLFSHIAMTEGNAEKAYGDTRKLFRLPRLYFDESPDGIGFYHSLRSILIACRTFQDMIHLQPPSEKQLLSISGEISRIDMADWARINILAGASSTIQVWDAFLDGDIGVEKFLLHKQDEMFSQVQKKIGEETIGSLKKQLKIDDNQLYAIWAKVFNRHTIRSEQAKVIYAYIKASELTRKPGYAVDEQLRQLDQELSNNKFIQTGHVSFFFRIQAHAQVYLDFVKLSIGLLQYHNQYGKYPDELSAIQPLYGENLPKDPFSGKDYIYVPGKMIYSIGENAIDDNGKSHLSRSEIKIPVDFVWHLPDLKPGQ